MKRLIGMLVSAVLLLTCITFYIPTVHAVEPKRESRAIAIVFDNSGSMYDNGDQSWCRATYATEVFASMLNEGDVLSIYPMNPIMVGEEEYTMTKPFVVTDADQGSSVREIFTKSAGNTHIESIDSAISDLQAATADKKYLIVVTDGDMFYRNNVELGRFESQRQLETRFEEHAGEEMTVMYLGIGEYVIMPDTPQSDYFTKIQSKDSEDVLRALTNICNQVFGRDILPKNRFDGNTINFDVSMKKLIVFVQGENIDNLKIVDKSGNPVGQQISSRLIQYSTVGCGAFHCVPDTSLQGMMVTYENCPAGTYDIQFTGTDTSTEVYYEPDAELDLLFMDATGSVVDYTLLYEGTYRVTFGIKDAKTGKMLSSNLLGNPQYHGSYYLNGVEVPIVHEGYSGEVPVELNAGDSFDARLTVTYLSGYTNTKNTADFGWPQGGIYVMTRTAGELRLEITGGDSSYLLQDLPEGSPFTAKLYYQGQQLTGEELSKVKLTWDSSTSNATILKDFADDHFDLYLDYKNPDVPQNTACGECTVPIYAEYTARGSNPSETEGLLTYTINDEFVLLQVDLSATEDYILISELEDSEPLVAELKLNGSKLSARDFDSSSLEINSKGLEYEIIPHPEDSSFLIQLQDTKGAKEGDYLITATAIYNDHIGRPSQAEDAVTLTLSHTALWLKWLIGLLLLLLIIFLIVMILRIKVLPKHLFTSKKISSMVFDGDNVTSAANFISSLKGQQAKIQTNYAGRNFGITMSVAPGKDSFLYKPQNRKSAEVKVASVKKFGPAKIQEAMIGSAKYTADENGKLVPALAGLKPFPLKHGTVVRYSGTINDAGVDKDFEVSTKLNFKK